MADFRIVSRPDCIWCTRAKAHLALRDLSFTEELKVTKDEQLAFKAEGYESFPQIWRGDEHIGGFTELKQAVA
jgi:glutaredoxin